MGKNNKAVILNICNKIPITQHTVYAIPLSIILSNSDYWPWVYQKFVQIYSSRINGPTIKLRLFYYDKKYAFKELLHSKKIDQIETVKEIKDIVEFVIESINGYTYVSMYIDMLYVEEKNTGTHSIQKVLLFGYDTEKEMVYVKGYDHTLKFATYAISFDELKKAFLYNKEENYDTKEYPIELFKIREIDNNPTFSITEYKKQLSDYLCSRNVKTEFLQCGRSINELESFGIDAYKDFEEYIELAVVHAYRVPYHDFHLFYEHRKFNMDRFEYINTLLEEKIEVHEYKDIVKECSMLRMSYMKEAVKRGGLYKPIFDKKIMLKYKVWMEEINKTETEALYKIMRIMES